MGSGKGPAETDYLTLEDMKKTIMKLTNHKLQEITEGASKIPACFQSRPAETMHKHTNMDPENLED